MLPHFSIENAHALHRIKYTFKYIVSKHTEQLDTKRDVLLKGFSDTIISDKE